MLFIRKLKPSLNVQADSIRAKVFTWRSCDYPHNYKCCREKTDFGYLGDFAKGLTDRHPITSRLNWPVRSITRVWYQWRIQREGWSPKKIFSALRASVWSKNRGHGGLGPSPGSATRYHQLMLVLFRIPVFVPGFSTHREATAVKGGQEGEKWVTIFRYS